MATTPADAKGWHLSGISNALNIVRIWRNLLQLSKEHNYEGIPTTKTLKEEFLEARSHALKMAAVYHVISTEACDAPGKISDAE